MTDAVNEVEVEEVVAGPDVEEVEAAPEAFRGTIMEYINGLMIGSVPQEFFELLISKIGLIRCNQVIALAGVKYITTLRENALKDVAEANDPAVSVSTVLDKQLPTLIEALTAIFGE